MLVDNNLKNLFRAILNDAVNDDHFNDLVVSAKVKLDDTEWNVPNKLLEKSEELSLFLGGKEKKMVH